MSGAHDLYGLPLDRFVAARGALAKALRADGRREEAAGVAALRKPSVAAWSVNQLVRTQSRGVGALFDAGDELQRAHAEVLAGRGDGRALRDATQIERRAVDELAGLARGLLSSSGHEPTQATIDRVTETLHAAALDADARAQVRDGCLERELRRVGLGSSEAMSAPAEREQAPRARAQREAEGREQAESERAERQRAEELKAARKHEASTRRAAERAARELQAAQERREHAAGTLRDAEEELAAARERADAAALAHRDAQQAL